MEISLQNLFPFSRNLFFFKDRIEEFTRFVAAVNNFPWEINSSNTTALHARCTFRRVRNRFQPQTSLWKYENTMLIKIVAMFRNLLISSFDATIRVKRAFHPALASRGFASHVFLVYKKKVATQILKEAWSLHVYHYIVFVNYNGRTHASGLGENEVTWSK